MTILSNVHAFVVSTRKLASPISLPTLWTIIISARRKKNHDSHYNDCLFFGQTLIFPARKVKNRSLCCKKIIIIVFDLRFFSNFQNAVMSAQQSHSGPLSLISCVSARESSPIDDVVESKSGEFRLHTCECLYGALLGWDETVGIFCSVAMDNGGVVLVWKRRGTTPTQSRVLLLLCYFFSSSLVCCCFNRDYKKEALSSVSEFASHFSAQESTAGCWWHCRWCCCSWADFGAQILQHWKTDWRWTGNFKVYEKSDSEKTNRTVN